MKLHVIYYLPILRAALLHVLTPLFRSNSMGTLPCTV